MSWNPISELPSIDEQIALARQICPAEFSDEECLSKLRYDIFVMGAPIHARLHIEDYVDPLLGGKGVVPPLESVQIAIKGRTDHGGREKVLCLVRSLHRIGVSTTLGPISIVRMFSSSLRVLPTAPMSLGRRLSKQDD